MQLHQLPVVINLAALNTAFEAGDTVSPQTLIAKGLINLRRGKAPQVKILGNGDISKKVTLSGCVYSGSAKTKIEAAGGSIL